MTWKPEVQTDSTGQWAPVAAAPAPAPAHEQDRAAAIKLAGEIGENSPLGLIATRMTIRGDIADRVRKATDHELEEQARFRKTVELTIADYTTDISTDRIDS